MATVTLTNVGKVYEGGVQAVRDFNLDIADGEFIVLVGPSGSGKSTVLRMIAGLEEITTGEIRIGERIVNRLHPKDRDIAMVFQDYALYPHMTVAGNMSFALRLRGLTRDAIRGRVQRTAEMLGIGELLQRFPGVLSGGQQQRVALGRAIVREPAAFLFDEPLSNLDARLRVAMRAEIRAVQRRLGTTSIYVTHDQEEAMSMADRMVVVCDGRAQQVDAPLRVYARPVNRFVASFIGSPPMNFYEGAVHTSGPELIFRERAVVGNGSAGGFTLNLPHGVDVKPDAAIVLGIRPPAFTESMDDEESCGAITMTIEQVEPLGDVTDVRGVTPGGHALVARLPAREDRPRSGMIRLTVGPASVHLFEPGPFGRAVGLDRSS